MKRRPGVGIGNVCGSESCQSSVLSFCCAHHAHAEAVQRFILPVLPTASCRKRSSASKTGDRSQTAPASGDLVSQTVSDSIQCCDLLAVSRRLVTVSPKPACRRERLWIGAGTGPWIGNMALVDHGISEVKH